MSRPSAVEDTSTEGSSVPERRGAPRHGYHLEGDCQPVTANEAGNRWPIHTLDISTSGVAIRISRRFERGTLLALELCRPSKEPVSMPLARVCRVTRFDQHWLLGCTWQGAVRPDELQELAGAKGMWHAVQNRVKKAKAAVEQLCASDDSSETVPPARDAA